jgi:hypothetical protein
MSRRDKEFDEIRAMLHRLEHNVHRIEHDVLRLLRLLKQDHEFPTAIHSRFEGAYDMPVSLTVGQKVTQTLTETDATGNNVPVVPGNLTNTSSDPTIASVVDNNDGIFTWTAVAAGTATSSFADTAFNLSGTDTLIVTSAADVPTAIVSTFGTPS